MIANRPRNFPFSRTKIEIEEKTIHIETVAKKVDWPKIMLLIKYPQFLSNQADIQAILPTHELVIFTKFPNNSIEIEDFY